MLTQVQFQVIQVTVKDWEMEGRKGTSHKAQILIEQDGLPSTLFVKFKPEVALERGHKYNGQIEITDASGGGYVVMLNGVVEQKKAA